jgi:branched-chain amino acid transport system ATP-binding protein
MATNKLIITNITKQFNSVKALNNVTIKLEQNVIYGLIGPNGSGKTTLFNCISGVYKVDQGNIAFNHHKLNNLSPTLIAQLGIRRTFQTIRLPQELTVAENIYAGYLSKSKQNLFTAICKGNQYYTDEHTAWNKVKEIAKLCNLTDYLPQKTANLSYGLQRRVELARAIISRPKLLILDEVAAGMNEREKVDITNTIEQIQQQNLMILLIEHDMKMINALCSNLFVLHHGQLIANGHPKEVLNNKEVIEAYMGTTNA